MCNRFLSLEEYFQIKRLNNNVIILKTDFFSHLKCRKLYYQNNIRNEFTLWPFDITNNRQMPSFIPSFPQNNNLHRRIFLNDENTIQIDYNFLSTDRRSLLRERARRWDSSALSFWINPKVDIAVQYSIYNAEEDDLKLDIEDDCIYFPHPQLLNYLFEEEEDDIDAARFGEPTNIFGKRYSIIWNKGLAITLRVSNMLKWENKDALNLEFLNLWSSKKIPNDSDLDLIVDLRRLKFPNRIITETVNNGKNIPKTLQSAIRYQYGTYIAGDIQPMKRSGFIWPGTNPFLFIPKTYFRPFSERDLRPELELDLPKKGYYIGR